MIGPEDDGKGFAGHGLHESRISPGFGNKEDFRFPWDSPEPHCLDLDKNIRKRGPEAARLAKLLNFYVALFRVTEKRGRELGKLEIFVYFIIWKSVAGLHANSQ